MAYGSYGLYRYKLLLTWYLFSKEQEELSYM